MDSEGLPNTPPAPPSRDVVIMKRHFRDAVTPSLPNLIEAYFLHPMGAGGLDKMPWTGAISGSVNGDRAEGPGG